MTPKSWNYKSEEKPESFVMSFVIHKRQCILLDKILDNGFFSSRSQLIRTILDQYLIDYIKRIQMLDLLTPEQIRIMGE